MRLQILFLALILELPFTIISAQYYETGQDPSSIKWMQIKTGRFTVIYPEKYEAGGIAFAQSLDDSYSKLLTLFPEKKFRIPVVIHSYTTQSNGYVAWAPRRMEIYPTPEQNSIPLDPYKQLAVHELAHVFQMESLNSGFSRAMTVPFGEQFTGLVASLLPLWFLEGDAVFAETFLSGSGRGRSPSFQKQIKALSLEKEGYYNYDKSLNGSYRDFIPDHYQYGYQMVAWSLLKYNPGLWNNVLKFTAGQPFTLIPVNISLRKNTGLTKKGLHKETFDTLRSIWSDELIKQNSKVYEALNPDKKGSYINYYSPVFAGGDSIIAIKTSLSDPPAFVMISTSGKTEKKIHNPGQIYPWTISYGKNKLVWVENQSDIRWENREYSIIRVLDLKKNSVRRLSRKTRYLAASVSPDGKTISAIENTVANKNNLVLIEAENGKVLKTIPAPENVILQHPQWAENGKTITVIYLTGDSEGIMSFSPDQNSWKILLIPGNDDIQSASIRNDSLFFISSQSGTDNIFLKTPDNKIVEMTRSKFGANDLSLSGGRLLFSDYTYEGNSICYSDIRSSSDPTDIKSSAFLINRFEPYKQENDSKTNNIYTPEPYRKWQHLIRFHSWMPFYADLEEIKSDPALVRPGISLLAQNTLSTLTSTIGYEYSKEKKHIVHSLVTWKGWYPVIETRLDYGDAPQINKSGENVNDPSVVQAELSLKNTISIPLRFSSGSMTEYLRPSFTSEYSNKYIYIKEDQAYDYGQTILSGRLYFSNYSRSAFRDIYPKWAQSIDLNYVFAPSDKNIYGTGLSLLTSFYFPGLIPNNGIRIRFETEKMNPAKYLYQNRVSLPRGFKNIISKQPNLLSIDYVMPLVYPDFNISSLIYLKRIRAGLFYDYASATGNYYPTNLFNGKPTSYFHNYNETFRSYGFELLADFHILRIPYMISGGIQSAWMDENKKPSVEMLFKIDIFGMILGKRQL